MNYFAKVIDKERNYHYLSADSEEAIIRYCDDNDFAINNWASNVTPIMVCFHFKWVGKRSNPFVIAKPVYEYKDDKYIGKKEFKEKF